MSVESPALQLLFNDVAGISCLALQLHNVIIVEQTRVTFLFVRAVPVVVLVAIQDELDEVLENMIV